MGFENGPFIIQNDSTLALSPTAWNKRMNYVWFEQPVGVGFSYSSVPADYQNLNDDVAASDNAAFLTAFFAAFPQYRNNPLYLSECRRRSHPPLPDATALSVPRLTPLPLPSVQPRRATAAITFLR